MLFYWWRLRVQPLQELLAAAGIAAGVALLFAVQVANSSIGGSVEQLVHGITGDFTLQVAAHDSRGFTEAFAAEVKRIDGVRLAAPVLEQRVGIAGSGGRATVDLVGVTDAISDAGGPLVDGFGGRFGLRLANALLIPQPLAARVGARRDGFVTLATRKPVAQRVPVSAILDRSQIGTAIDSPLVVAPLAYVQRLTGLEGRVTRILVAVRPGREQQVRHALAALVGGRLAVARSDAEVGYVEQAATPNNQSTGLFAGICAVVGALLAFTAVLMTLPERQRTAQLRAQGYKRRHILLSIVLEATVLGAVASLAGLLLGDLLSRFVFRAAPGYLAFAFPIGGVRLVGLSDLTIPFAIGVGVSLTATLPLLGDLFSRRSLVAFYRDDGDRGELIGPRLQLALAAIGCSMLAATAVLAIRGTAAIAYVLLLALAMLTFIPASLDITLRIVDRAIDGMRGRALPLAVMELRNSLTRATALAATAALAVFGTVAVGGAHRDLLHGLDVTAAAMLDTTDVWVTAAGDDNILMTTPFQMPDRRALIASGAVADVRAYRGEFLDWAGRRVWVMARPPGDRPLISPTDVQAGGVARSARLVRSGGWAALSASIADELHVGVGDRFAIPTPTGPHALRVAAIVSNLGWAPGTVVLNGRDYSRWWPGTDVTALEVDLRPGVAPAYGRAAVRHALPAGSPLLVETQAERKARFGRLERQGLNRLTQISTLLLIAAVVAMGAAMAGTVWQQRRRLAALRMQGDRVADVLRLLLMQAFLVLTPGAALGAAFGLCGQALATRWLRITTGFPTTFDLSMPLALLMLAVVALLGMVAAAIPVWITARTDPALALRTD